MGHPLPLRFYARGAAALAEDLLGKTLAAAVRGRVRKARIVETEAYVGEHDRASHARFGPTARNASMYGPPARAYVYRVYGLHHCLNVVGGSPGDPQAVLVRAAEPLDGWAARLSGPALLARAFGVTRRLDGHDLRRPPLWVEEGPAPARIGRTARIGVGYAGAWAKAPLRFHDAASPHVSGPRHRRTFKP